MTLSNPRSNRLSGALLAAVVSALAALPADAQVLNTNTRSVGGITIDADGMVRNADVADIAKFAEARKKTLSRVPEGLNEKADMRKISLKRLQAAIAECQAQNRPLPDAIRFLAGLQRIEYIFVVPEQNDIIIAGPADGWKVDAQGNVVAARSGRPVMSLDDLVTALRAAGTPTWGEVTCSIDPTEEGLKILREKVAGLTKMGKPKETTAELEKALGRQRITITGVPGESHFAHVLLAADYRMKRLAMNFDRAPIEGLPSYLEMLKTPEQGMGALLPRWWLAPDYKPLLRDEAGLTWQFRGAAIKAMSEDDFLTVDGRRFATGAANPTAQRWAEAMTAAYPRLATAEPIFGQLQNCVDLTILAHLLEHEGLAAKAGCKLDVLNRLPIASYPVFKEVDSQASLLRRGGGWIVSVSGGVKVNTKKLTEKPERSKQLEQVRDEAKLAEHADWWWN